MTLDNKDPTAEGRRDGKTRAENSANQALFDKLDRLLAKAKPSKRELIQKCFRDLYPRLEAHLANGIPLKEVLAAFNQLAQAKVCARTFNDMLEQERALRDRNGNPVCCATCGSLLVPRAATEPTPFASGIQAAITPLTE